MEKAYKSFLISSKDEGDNRVGWDMVTPNGRAYEREISFPIVAIDGDHDLHDTLCRVAQYLYDEPSSISADTESINGKIYRVHKIDR